MEALEIIVPLLRGKSEVTFAITGSLGQITEAIARFSVVGVTRVEVWPVPSTLGVIERLAPVFATFASARAADSV